MHDLGVLSVVELDEATCETAAAIAELTGVPTLDALHLAAAQRVGGAAVPFLTLDLRQAQAARALGSPSSAPEAPSMAHHGRSAWVSRR